MVLGLGTDFLETSRVERELMRGAWLPENGIFTPEEIRRCSSAGKPARCFAACFAAKEAALKALGVKVSDLAMFQEVELAPALNGRFEIILRNRLESEAGRLGVRRIHLSIADDGGRAGAIVILED
jgi:holo-[acyl-carrier protein] synthase